MDEEQTNEGDKKEEPVSDADKGVQSETVVETERINADTERLNKAIAENENAKARAKISGVAEAGQMQEKKEETPKEYSNRMLRGG